MTPHRKRGERRGLRVDFHSHTRYSPDARTTPALLVERAREVGLDRVAVTDHGEIEGALRARELDPHMVIVGEEIRCRCQTELIGLFLQERVPEGLGIEETARRVRDQGGVVYAPHPYAYAWRPVQRATRALEVADLVEAFNSRAFLPAWNRLGLEGARRRGLPVAAGSDAHFPHEIGRAYAELPHFAGPGELLAVAAQSQPVGVATANPALLLASASLKLYRSLVGGNLPRETAEEVAPRGAT